MSSMLADVITSGTANSARAAGFKLPAAGKTGTTDDYTDAWFVGYTPHLVTGVWFGMDKPAPIMNRGFASVVAVPAWAEFMKTATANDRPDWFQPPADVEKITICRLSGQRATDACRQGWMVPAYVQAGLTELPGIPAGAGVAVGTSGTQPTAAAAKPQSTVYDDYFPVGTAPASECAKHGAASLMGASGADSTMSSVSSLGRGASGGIVAASYSDSSSRRRRRRRRLHSPAHTSKNHRIRRPRRLGHQATLVFRGASPLGLPTRSLARRFAGALRSRGSLAALARATARVVYDMRVWMADWPKASGNRSRGEEGRGGECTLGGVRGHRGDGGGGGPRGGVPRGEAWSRRRIEGGGWEGGGGPRGWFRGV